MSITINDKMLTKVYQLAKEEERQEYWRLEEWEVHRIEEEEKEEQHPELLGLLLDLLLDFLQVGFYLATGLHERGQVDVSVIYSAHALVWLV